MIFLSLFPIGFIALAIIIYSVDQTIYNSMFGILETGFFEWIQFACYLFASIIAIISIIKNKADKISVVNILLFLFSLGCFFIAMEEISYGQHIFNWNTPSTFEAINLQNETNLHNLKFIMENNLQVKAFILIGLFGSFSWFFRMNSNSILSWKDILFVNRYLALYFFPIAAFYIHVLTGGHKHNHFQELFETVLSFGFLLIALFNFKKVKDYLKNHR